MPGTGYQDGKMIGYDGEILQRIADDLKLKVRPALMEWSGTIASVQAKRIDVMAGTMGWTEQRFDFSSPEAVRKKLEQEFAGFADEFLSLFRISNDEFAVRPIYALPVGHCWANRKGLTLLGDAAHVMSPFSGEGVNNALLDAVELARLLVDTERWADAVAEYERLTLAEPVHA